MFDKQILGSVLWKLMPHAISGTELWNLEKYSYSYTVTLQAHLLDYISLYHILCFKYSIDSKIEKKSTVN